MRGIRDSFIQKLDHSLAVAVVYLSALTCGRQYLIEYFKQNPGVRQWVGPHAPGSGSAYTRSVSGDSLDEIFDLHPKAMEEMTHTRLIQHWDDFLGQLFEGMVLSHIRGDQTYPHLGKVTFAMDFSSVGPGDSISEALIEGVVQKFQFTPMNEKFRVVRRGLGVKVDESLSNAINKYVVVRNIVEHNKGYVRQQDLKHLGLVGTGLPLLNERGVEIKIQAGQRIVLTFAQLCQTHDHLVEAAMSLVG